MSISNSTKTERIDVRASAAVEQLPQEAVRASHKSVGEYLLDAGLTVATQTLADRRRLAPDEARWLAFEQAPQRPVEAKPRLLELLREPGALG